MLFISHEMLFISHEIQCYEMLFISHEMLFISHEMLFISHDTYNYTLPLISDHLLDILHSFPTTPPLYGYMRAFMRNLSPEPD